MLTGMRARSVSFLLLAAACWGVVGYAALAYVSRPLGAMVHPEMAKAFQANKVAIGVHIACSAFALALVPVQVLGVVRATWPRVHRWSGRALLGLGVLPGGIAGLIAATFAFGGVVSTLGFGTLALAWLACGGVGLRAARKRDWSAHRAWMVRLIALTLAAVTLRVQLGIGLGLGPTIGLAFENFYPWLAWTSWVFNLLAAEGLLAWQRRAKAKETGRMPDARTEGNA
jgi:hypothetical protein